MVAVKRWLLVATIAWVLVIAGLAYYSLRTGRPTAREQTSIGSALPVVDAALGDIAAALDPATTVPVLGGYAELSHDCRITAVRDGSRYERVLVVYTKDGAEGAVLDRIAAGIPKRYRVRVRHGTKVQTLTADAGNFVLVQGGVDAPGQVRITADTGCRPLDRPVVESQPLATDNQAPVQAILDALHVRPERWQSHRVSCPGGGALWTVEATTAAGTTPAPPAVRAAAGSASVVLARNELYAYRSGSAGVAIRSVNGGLDVASTVGCG
jgi:hypothetical protein